MVTKSEYLSMVMGKAIPSAELDEKLDRLKVLLGTSEREQNLRDTLAAFVIDPECGYEGLVVIARLEEAKSMLEHPTFDCRNWHYDRTVGCLISNLDRGRHESLSATLYQIYTGNQLDQETAAEHFIDTGLGWFKSSTSFGRMLKGDSVRFTAQEKMVFGNIPVYES